MLSRHADSLDRDDQAVVPEWTPARGLVRAVAVGLVVAVLLAGLLAPVAWWFPYMITNAYLRTAIAFGLTWITLGAVQSAAGMVGWPCTTLALILVASVMLSHHVVFAMHGVSLHDGSLAVGWRTWLSPGALLGMNFGAIIGAGTGAWIRHDGGGGGAVTDILTARVWGTRR